MQTVKCIGQIADNQSKVMDFISQSTISRNKLQAKANAYYPIC